MSKGTDKRKSKPPQSKHDYLGKGRGKPPPSRPIDMRALMNNSV